MTISRTMANHWAELRPETIFWFEYTKARVSKNGILYEISLDQAGFYTISRVNSVTVIHKTHTLPMMETYIKDEL